LIFGRHDLVQDASISRLDLLACRNTLMYFNSDTQARILSRLHFSLAKDGYLFLGKAETLLTYGDSFRPVDLKRRIFQRISNAETRDDRFSLTPSQAPREDLAGGRRTELREAAFDRGPIVQLMVDRLGRLRLANERARALFGLTLGDIDRPLRDLEISYRPIDLRSAIDAAYATRQTVMVSDFSWQDRPSGSLLQLELQVSPIESGHQDLIGACLSFLDVTEAKSLKAELDRTLRNLEAAYEELQSANEELETTNEELQSAVEELETTNEELQSANEELETMNEELHSSNEELRMMNDQIVQRSAEVDLANDLLESTLENLHVGLAVLEADLSVATWSQGAEDLWGLRKHETLGQPFLQMDIGIPLGSLRQPIRDCQAGVAGRQVVGIDGVNRRGKSIRCQVSCTLLPESNGTPGRVLLIMAESPRLTKLVE
jgi:two-component system CheB/CheR fusion protein